MNYPNVVTPATPQTHYPPPQTFHLSTNMKFLSLILAVTVLGALTACRSNPTIQTAPNADTDRRLNPLEVGQAKQIQVFFDGTANDWSARTNVRRRFELLASAEDPQFPSLYFEGVGTESLVGKAFGLGMKERVIKAYMFLACHWSPTSKDRIHIYGFSRGAFQARMLAGLMAHCGLPDAQNFNWKAPEVEKLANSVYDFCADELTDLPETNGATRVPLAVWQQRLAENQERVRNDPKHKGWKFNNPKVDLLGIWDTVPGLTFVSVTDDGGAAPGKRQIYKVRPYPNTKTIIHALSLDEKRSKFTPLLVGPPIDPSCKVHEVWFPGVHSDVGGGYLDSNDLAGAPLSWMQEVMQLEHISRRDYKFYSDAHGLLHHPENVFFNSIGSHQQTRKIPVGSYVHFSVFKRANLEAHPEVGIAQGRVYHPTLEVTQSDGTTATLTLDAGPYNESTAAQALEKVGLKLYSQEVKNSNRTQGLPLNISQMVVPVTTATKVASPAPSPTPHQ